MKKIRIAGVPEHFNLPWHLCIENNEFESVDVDLNWINVPEGTGKMCQMLRNDETDIAVILTEGIVKDIIAGNPSKIVQIYVESPLIWGIHVGFNSKFDTLADLKNKKVAISRYGSGSQLMAYVNADNQNWNTETLDFEIVNTIDGAVDALTNGTADYFMWERLMTKPLVDQGIFRKIADCPTPWPCFVIAVREAFLIENPSIVSQILEIINKKSRIFKQISGIENKIADKYHLKIEDCKEWLKETIWSQNQISENELIAIQNKLVQLKIIDKTVRFAEITTKI
jgi:ABC-type nitrate/sulfonate/bicarbonate transport system substrate-binding protein